MSNYLPVPARLKWWDAANERRQRLILKKHGGELLSDEERELELLQQLADKILDNADLFQPEE